MKSPPRLSHCLPLGHWKEKLSWAGDTRVDATGTAVLPACSARLRGSLRVASHAHLQRFQSRLSGNWDASTLNLEEIKDSRWVT